MPMIKPWVETSPLKIGFFGSSTHLSVFNNLMLCSYIVPRCFTLAYIGRLFNDSITKLQLI
jgi:hypothetical protein